MGSLRGNRDAAIKQVVCIPAANSTGSVGALAFIQARFLSQCWSTKPHPGMILHSRINSAPLLSFNKAFGQPESKVQCNRLHEE